MWHQKRKANLIDWKRQESLKMEKYDCQHYPAQWYGVASAITVNSKFAKSNCSTLK